MNILGGLDYPSAGRVSVDGIDLLSLNEAGLNQYQRVKVGFVWQQTSRNLIPYLSALENIELPMTMAWVTSRQQKRAWAEELLNSVGLYHRRHHRLTQLSGGEQQRVAIAVSLANKPVLLLGDEPTGEVDTVTAQTIMDTFRSLRDRLGLSVIIVTHDPRIAEQVDRVVAIRDGKISTETVRQVNLAERVLTIDQLELQEIPGTTAASEPAATAVVDALPDAALIEQQVTYHEFVVLDSAGRLQIPKELREELGIGKRAQLEKGENCIVIRPVAGQGDDQVKKLTLEQQIELLFSGDQVPVSEPGSKGRKSIKWPGRK
jgi:putative ABC transport system ATP-binding protein